MRFSDKLKKILYDKKYLNELLDEYSIKIKSIKRFKDFRKCSCFIFGFIDHETDTIYIEKKLPKEEQEITILHDLLHLYYDQRGLPRNEYWIEKETMRIWWDKKYN